jgi:hypothetical protein
VRGAAARRGSAAIAARLERRLLWHTLDVSGDDEVLEYLRPAFPAAEHPMPAVRTMTYRVGRTDAGFEAFEEGDHVVTVSSAREAGDIVYGRAYSRAFELAALSGWARVHAATVDVGDARVLVVGAAGAGKTTFALALGMHGAEVQGDEGVLLRDGASLAVPRSMHLKDGTERVVPELEAVGPLPRIEYVRLLDPSRLGTPRRLRFRPVDHVVLLEPAVGPVTCRPAGTPTVLEGLVRASFLLTGSKPDHLGTLVAAAGRARGHCLTRGEPRAMVEALLGAIDELG